MIDPPPHESTDDVSERTPTPDRSRPSLCGRLRRALSLLAICALAGTAFVVAGPARSADAWAIGDNDWLGIVNAYRRQSGLPAVGNDAGLSGGARNHSCWMLVNGMSHAESPGTWGYSASGDRAGRNGNLSLHSDPSLTAREHIDQWMGGPFHAIGILRPGLSSTGFGMCSSPPSPSSGFAKSAATLDVLSGLTGNRRTSSPIVFPGRGARTRLTRFRSETPDPRTFCGWSGRTVGLPLLALMPNGVSSASSSLRGPGGNIPTCTLHRSNTSGVAQAILAGDNAVAVIPAAPLTPGTYTATVNSNGGSVSWSFTVDREAQLLGPPEPDPPSTRTLGAAQAYRSVTPKRIADSREGKGLTRLPARTVRRFRVAGKAGIPSTAIAVSANFTAVRGADNGHLTVFNCGRVPTVSTLNFRPVEAAANQAIVPLAGGDICVYASVATDLVIDVNGYVGSEANHSITPVRPYRVMDTRNGTRLRAGVVRRVKLAGRGSVPANATTVAVNLTSVRPARNGWIRAFPCGRETLVSSLNPQHLRARPNSAIVPMASDGTICLRSNVATDLVLDVTGWIGGSGRFDFQRLTPIRLADTRSSNRKLNPFRDSQRLTPDRTLEVRVAGVRGIPSAARGASLNIVAVGAGRPGWVRVEPCGASSRISTVNFQRPEAIANGTNVALSSAGAVCVTVNKPTHVIVDITGIWR